MNLKTICDRRCAFRGAIYRTGACAENWRKRWRVKLMREASTSKLCLKERPCRSFSETTAIRT